MRKRKEKEIKIKFIGSKLSSAINHCFSHLASVKECRIVVREWLVGCLVVFWSFMCLGADGYNLLHQKEQKQKRMRREERDSVN